MKFSLALVLLVATLALPTVRAAAQDASVREDTRLQRETQRKRLIVRPDAPVGNALEDAGRAADELAERRLIEREAARARRPPQLDPDVTNAIQSRNLQRALSR
jgi:hypothetical protein